MGNTDNSDSRNIKYSYTLKKYADDELIKKCSNCSMCREVCPMYLISDLESSYPGGRMRILRTFAQEKLKITTEFLDNFAYCSTCKKCEDFCPIHMNYVEILEMMRKELVTNLSSIPQENLTFSRNTYLENNPYGEPRDKRFDWVSDDVVINTKSKIGYFVGCTSSYREKESARMTVKILSHIHTEGINLLGNKELCCGSPLMRTGQVQFSFNDKSLPKLRDIDFSIKRLIGKDISLIQKRGIEILICNCSGCYKTIVQDWPQYIEGSLPFEVLHLTEYVANLASKAQLTFRNLNKKVTYHDPCHLGRYLDIYDAPRKILNAIPGLKLIEMKNIRKDAVCCGAGGGLRARFPEESIKIAKLRIREAINTNADYLVTACVFCKNQFELALKEFNTPLKVLNIEELMGQLLK